MFRPTSRKVLMPALLTLALAPLAFAVSAVSKPVPAHIQDLVESVRDGKRQSYSLIDDHVASIFIDTLEHTKEHDHDCHH